jgi:prophage regulatory protein
MSTTRGSRSVPTPEVGSRNRLIRFHEVSQLVGLSRSTVWRLERQGAFPSRRQIASRAVGWMAEEIQQWIADRDRFNHRLEGPTDGNE